MQAFSANGEVTRGSVLWYAQVVNILWKEGKEQKGLCHGPVVPVERPDSVTVALSD
jgi:hypothetical protein